MLRPGRESLVNTPDVPGFTSCRKSATFLPEVRWLFEGLAGLAVTTRIVIFSLGILVSGIGFADELNDADATESVSAATYILPADLTSEPQWRLSDTASDIVYTSIPTTPLFDVEFRDSDTLKQLSKLRNLSFLTLAEKWNSKFFLGVNRDGLVGFHFTLSHRQNQDQMLELTRLSYLNDDESFKAPQAAEK